MAEEIIHSSIANTHGGARLGSIGEIFRDTAGEAAGRIAEEGERRGRALTRKRTAALAYTSVTLAVTSLRRTVDRTIPLPLRRFFTLIAALALTAGGAIASKASVALTELHCLRYRVADRLSRFTVARAAAAVFLAASVAVVISTAIVSVGLQVYLDGEPLGFVGSQSDFEDVVASVEKKASDILGYPYAVQSDIRYEFDMVNRRDMLDLHEVEAALFSEISEIKRLYVLTVDGEALCASADKAAITEELDALLAPYRTDAENETVSFILDNSLTLEYTDASLEMSRDDVAAALRKNVREAESYEIQPGDTLARIAASHGTTADTLVAMNPGVSASTLRAGEPVAVTKALPLLSVKVEKVEVYNVAIPHDTEKIPDDTLYVGTTKVNVAGVDGSKQITANVTYIDGAEENREILEELVQSEPITEVLRVGTKKRVATGNFIRPFVGGYISSHYGYRTFRGRGDMHTGTDFTSSGARGKPIRASDGGTVTFAGWKGSYGNLVIIDHGNGYQTYYAHCQSFMVSVGQKVAQGENIARVGSTGRSTGPHLHFEIRINGNHVNPMNYIRG
ncbi:peptidoglycan DD-metalloendopeptidase family protein [Oscillospiraceae bacterium OttesenSCG-928-G22]|nr:peptidoglycan DD-metalloendopeptidase family protein [Oscillospiraceae bacterium OttesenSCG-928-G22]